MVKFIQTLALSNSRPDFRQLPAVVNDILTNEPVKLNISNLVPIRIRTFIRRLWNGVNQVTATIPDLNSDPDIGYLNEARESLIDLSTGTLWSFLLPQIVTNKLNALVDCDRDLVIKFVNNLAEQIGKSVRNSSLPQEKESLQLLWSFLIRFNESGVFLAWTELVQTWSAMIYDERDDGSGFRFLTGIPGLEIDQTASSCVLQSIDELRALTCQLSSDSPDLPDRQPPVVLYRTDRNFISRGDWDIITGRIFWTKLMACDMNANWNVRSACWTESVFKSSGTEVGREVLAPEQKAADNGDDRH